MSAPEVHGGLLQILLGHFNLCGLVSIYREVNEVGRVKERRRFKTDASTLYTSAVSMVIERDEDSHHEPSARDIVTKLEAQSWDTDPKLFWKCPRQRSLKNGGIECTPAPGGLTRTSSSRSILKAAERVANSLKGERFMCPVRQHVSSFDFWEVWGLGLPFAVASEAARAPYPYRGIKFVVRRIPSDFNVADEKQQALFPNLLRFCSE